MVIATKCHKAPKTSLSQTLFELTSINWVCLSHSSSLWDLIGWVWKLSTQAIFPCFWILEILQFSKWEKIMFHQLVLDNLPTTSKGRNPHLDWRLLLMGVMICWLNCAHSKDITSTNSWNFSSHQGYYYYLFIIINLNFIYNNWKF